VRAAVEAEVEREIAAAIDFAENSPFPEAKELFTDVYA
jgi:TPP-dependent pyruvate/acetoin dehydrogenase alpha subunit